MCRELEAADCGDVIYFPYAFMLRATAMNRIGHAQSDNERLNLSLMTDSSDNERLAPPKVILSPENDPLERSKVTLSSKSDTFIADSGSALGYQSGYADYSNKEENTLKLAHILEGEVFNKPTKLHILTLYRRIANNEVFGRKEIIAILGCSIPTGRRLLNVLKGLDLIIPIKGNGKGRYMFKEISE